MAGPDVGDALSAPVPLRSYREGELLSMCIGILESDALGVPTPEARAAVERAAKLLGDRGFAIEPFRMHGLDRALDLWWLLVGPVMGNLILRGIVGVGDRFSLLLHE